MRKKILIAALILLLATGGYLSYRILRPALSNKANTYFYIEEGEDLATVQKNLTDQGFIRGSGFRLTCRLLRFTRPRPGRYQFRHGMNLYDLVRMLRKGEQALVRITVVKERTRELLAGKFGPGKKFDLRFDSLQLARFLNNNDSLKRFGVDSHTVMSLIIPDTYLHPWNSDPAHLLQQFQQGYDRFWNARRTEQAKKQGLSPRDVMILASIVEEETNRKVDKPNVASTYINRLRKGMRLQADPTVKYVTRNFKLGRITGTHLRLESPYNTYLNTGLPPGPICTPSKESIEAVLQAPETEYLFFVASYRFDGSSIFSKTLDEHNRYARLFHQEQSRRADSIRNARVKLNRP